MDITTLSKPGSSVPARAVALGALGVLVAGLVGGLLFVRPWQPDHPTALSAADAFTTALMERDEDALLDLALADGEQAWPRVEAMLAQLPDGDLTIEEAVLTGGVGAFDAELAVDLSVDAGEPRTFTVLLTGDVGESGTGDADWKITFPEPR